MTRRAIPATSTALHEYAPHYTGKHHRRTSPAGRGALRRASSRLLELMWLLVFGLVLIFAGIGIVTLWNLRLGVM